MPFKQTKLAAVAYLLPALVFLPLIGVAPKFDQEYHTFHFGVSFAKNPFGLIHNALGAWRSMVVEGFGNYRPIGRFLEQSLDWLMFLVVQFTRIPLNWVLSSFTAIAACVLTWSVVRLAVHQLQSAGLSRDKANNWKLPIIAVMSATFVASGGQSPALLFGGLYFLSASAVLISPVLAFKIWHSKLHASLRVLFLLMLGGLFAIFNELTYVAPVFIFLTALSTAFFTNRRKIRDLLKFPDIRAALVVLAGFIPVFVPLRLLIANICRQMTCYQGSDVQFSSKTVITFFERSVSWFPPFQQISGLNVSYLVPAKLIIAGLVLLFLALSAAFIIWRKRKTSPPTDSGVAAKASWSLLISGVGLTLVSALLVAPSPKLQQYSMLGRGWRENGLTASGGTLALVAAVAILVIKFRAPRFEWLPSVALALVLTFLTGSVVANAAVHYFNILDPRSATMNVLYEELVSFDLSKTGEAARCETMSEMQNVYKVKPAFVDAFNHSSIIFNGTPFCKTAKGNQ